MTRHDAPPRPSPSLRPPSAVCICHLPPRRRGAGYQGAARDGCRGGRREARQATPREPARPALLPLPGRLARHSRPTLRLLLLRVCCSPLPCSPALLLSCLHSPSAFCYYFTTLLSLSHLSQIVFYNFSISLLNYQVSSLHSRVLAS